MPLALQPACSSLCKLRLRLRGGLGLLRLRGLGLLRLCRLRSSGAWQGLELLVLLLVLLVLVGLQSVVQLVSFVASLPLAGGEGSSCQCRIPPTPRSLVELQGQWKIYVCERSLSGQPAAKP